MDIGEKLKRLRILNELTQDELAQRCDLTKGFISKVERNITSPSIATLIDILEALGTDIQKFFNEDVQSKVVFFKEDMDETENQTLQHKITWLVPNTHKNLMDPILIELNHHGTSHVEKPHSGEEFGYVLNGSIDLCLGNKKFKVKKGESFYFKSNLIHYIENTSNKSASVLWVVAPPSL